MKEFENYYKLPELILEIMNWLCETKFYNKTFKERKQGYEEINEKWKFCDFVVEEGTLSQPIVIKIGLIPHYQGDYEKTILIDFKHKDNCYLIRGYATGPYASKVIKNMYPIPKYMKEQLYKYIDIYKIEAEGEKKSE